MFSILASAMAKTWEEMKVFLTGFSILLGFSGLVIAVTTWPRLIIYLSWTVGIVVGALFALFLSLVLGAWVYRIRGKELPKSLKFLNNPLSFTSSEYYY